MSVCMHCDTTVEIKRSYKNRQITFSLSLKILIVPILKTSIPTLKKCFKRQALNRNKIVQQLKYHKLNI